MQIQLFQEPVLGTIWQIVWETSAASIAWKTERWWKQLFNSLVLATAAGKKSQPLSKGFLDFDMLKGNWNAVNVGLTGNFPASVYHWNNRTVGDDRNEDNFFLQLTPSILLQPPPSYQYMTEEWRGENNLSTPKIGLYSPTTGS